MVPEDYRICRPDRRQLIKYFCCAFPLMFLVGYVFYRSIVAGLATGLLTLPGLRLYALHLADVRYRDFRLQFKDLLYSTASSVTAGRHLKEALGDAQDTVVLIYGEDAVVARELRHMLRTIKEMNCSEEECLLDLAKRTGLPEVYDFADVCITCRTTGGDLSAMIIKAVNLLSANLDLRQEKEVMLSQKKLESRILAAMPAVVTALINLTSSDYLEIMYTCIAGRILMTIALGATGISFAWTIKLTSEKDRQGGVV